MRVRERERYLRYQSGLDSSNSSSSSRLDNTNSNSSNESYTLDDKGEVEQYHKKNKDDYIG